MSEDDGECVSEDERECVSEDESECVSEDESECVSEDECASEDGLVTAGKMTVGSCWPDRVFLCESL